MHRGTDTTAPRLRPSQRMLAQGVLGLGARLVRAAQAQRFSAVSADMHAAMGERHELLRRLQGGIRSAAELSCVEALQRAVCESDRGMLAMMEMQD